MGLHLAGDQKRELRRGLELVGLNTGNVGMLKGSCTCSIGWIWWCLAKVKSFNLAGVFSSLSA